MSQPPASLAFVLLAYNEEASLAGAIADCRRFARERDIDYQIVVVDDGSTDGTAEQARAVDRGDVTLVVHERNRGMGASMRDGYLAARCDYLAHLPGDRQVRADALREMWPLRRPDRVVLSRFTNAPSGAGRAAMSAVFRVLARRVGRMSVNFAGTYLFHQSWLHRVPLERADSDTFLFSFQLLELMSRAGARFRTVGVETFPREVGTSREATPGRIARMFYEITRARMSR